MVHRDNRRELPANAGFVENNKLHGYTATRFPWFVANRVRFPLPAPHRIPRIAFQQRHRCQKEPWLLFSFCPSIDLAQGGCRPNPLESACARGCLGRICPMDSRNTSKGRRMFLSCELPGLAHLEATRNVLDEHQPEPLQLRFPQQWNEGSHESCCRRTCRRSFDR